MSEKNTNIVDLFEINPALFQEKQSLLIAVSGGMDSMFLLHYIQELSSSYNFKLAVVHVNHGLRDQESDIDELFVMREARRLKLPFFGVRVDVKKAMLSTGQSLETCARNLRYSVLEKLRLSLSFENIVLGHHQSDQAETILFNLLRGSGLRGLRGMQQCRDKLIRPLLQFDKEKMDVFMRENALSWRDDSSNRDLTYSRNYLRHEVLKNIVDRFGPASISAVSRAGDAAKEADEFLRHEAEKAYQHCLKQEQSTEIQLEIMPFLGYLKVLQKYMFVLSAERLLASSANISAFELEKLVNLATGNKKGKQIKLNNGISVFATAETLAIVKKQSKIYTRIIDIGNETSIPEVMGKMKISNCLKNPGEAIIRTVDKNVEYVDADCIKDSLTLRACKPGDYFYPLGMNGRKKLKDFFNDEKIPAYKRSAIPLLCQGKDIIWIVGRRLDNRYKVKSNSKNVICLSFCKELE